MVFRLRGAAFRSVGSCSSERRIRGDCALRRGLSQQETGTCSESGKAIGRDIGLMATRARSRSAKRNVATIQGGRDNSKLGAQC